MNELIRRTAQFHTELEASLSTQCGHERLVNSRAYGEMTFYCVKDKDHSGAHKYLDLPGPCPACGGEGYRSDDRKCIYCNGFGEVFGGRPFHG